MLLEIHVPGWHTGAQLGHSHSNALDEQPTDQPTPNHASGSSITHPIGQRTSNTGKQTQDCEGDAEGGPERELPFEFLSVTQSYQGSLIGVMRVGNRNIAIGQDRCDLGFARIIALAFRMRVRALVALDLSKSLVHPDFFVNGLIEADWKARHRQEDA
jgi:hypothetical protein